jgi:hypothetical protein
MTLAASWVSCTNCWRGKSVSQGDPQVLSYRHADRRKNNPEVGLVNEASDPEQPRLPGPMTRTWTLRCNLTRPALGPRS